MDKIEIKSALQDLIIRLQDAEKGFKEIVKATSNTTLKKWLTRYANERHVFHTVLEEHVKILGGKAAVNTSYLGDIHRMFIDVKINNTSFDNEFEAIVAEIERGATVLINDYETVLSKMDLSSTLIKALSSQRNAIKSELDELISLKQELMAVA